MNPIYPHPLTEADQKQGSILYTNRVCMIRPVEEAIEPFSIGGSDTGPIPLAGVGDEGGMLVGPDHPGFWQRRPDPNRTHPPEPSFLPPYPAQEEPFC